MIHAAITKDFTFEAAHMLPNHKGKCRNLHGHSYKISLAFHGPISETENASDEGMVVDFGDITALWKEHLEPVLDHKYLNDSLNLRVPTAENIAVEIIRRALAAEPTFEAYLIGVEIWETETSSVTVSTMDVMGEGEETDESNFIFYTN